MPKPCGPNFEHFDTPQPNFYTEILTRKVLHILCFQDESGEWYYEDSSYNYEGGEGNESYEGWYQDENGEKKIFFNIPGIIIFYFKIIKKNVLGEWIYDENHAASSTNKSTTESTTTNGSLDKNNVANAVANETIVDQGAKAKVKLLMVSSRD